MHIQSVNGILLDDLDCEAASKKIRDISEGQVFLMVRAAHRDTEKAAQSPMVTQLGTPSLRSPLSIWKGVCRFNANPFMLTWVEKEVLVVVRSNQVQLIPALIMVSCCTSMHSCFASFKCDSFRLHLCSSSPIRSPRTHLGK